MKVPYVYVYVGGKVYNRLWSKNDSLLTLPSKLRSNFVFVKVTDCQRTVESIPS